MDRAAKLAKCAKALLGDEKAFPLVPADKNREITRFVLGEMAGSLGFAPNEISAAVDEALTAAGTTP